MQDPPLGGLPVADFLARHWQRRELLVRRALPDFEPPFTPEQLAGLACEEDVNARLVLERHGRAPWEVRHGPFEPDEFTRLPATHWTLLVEEVDRLLPGLTPLMDRFRFLPDWRRDDLMVTYAAPEGSVGPHVDSYDVFLLQASGRRRWDIGPVPDPRWREGLDLRILERFTPAESFVLEPGDLLYLPPGMGHHGVALEPALTFSIGFLAPARAELVAAWASELAAAGHDPRYGDPGLAPRAHPAEITAEDLERVVALMRSLPLEDAGLERWFGELVTRPRGGGLAEPQVTDAASVERAVAAGAGLRRSEQHRCAFLRIRGGGLVFVDGETVATGGKAVEAAGAVTDRRILSRREAGALLSDPGTRPLVLALIERAVLEPVDG
jgi:50S ribosomal protein L16 3-hydroxylase